MRGGRWCGRGYLRGVEREVVAGAEKLLAPGQRAREEGKRVVRAALGDGEGPEVVDDADGGRVVRADDPFVPGQGTFVDGPRRAQPVRLKKSVPGEHQHVELLVCVVVD